MWITRPDCSVSFCWVQVQKAVDSHEVSFFDRIQYLVIECFHGRNFKPFYVYMINFVLLRTFDQRNPSVKFSDVYPREDDDDKTWRGDDSWRANTGKFMLAASLLSMYSNTIFISSCVSFIFTFLTFSI